MLGRTLMTVTIHPRQLEILRNNYELFIRRASETKDKTYHDSCIEQAAATARLHWC